MSTDPKTPANSSGSSFTFVLICVVLVSVAFMTWMSLSRPSGVALAAGLQVGSSAPQLAADVWVKGGGPDPAELEGEVYVVIAWATWCLPCYQEAPHLVKVHKQFQSEQVQFFGLTSEPPEAQRQVLEWLDDTGISWPNGFGMTAAQTLQEYQADYIPAMWIIGRDGKVWWNRGMSDTESLEDGLRRTLDDSKPATAESASS